MKKSIWIILCCLVPSLTMGQIHIILEKIPENTPKNARVYMASPASAWQANDKRFMFHKEADKPYILTLKNISLPLEFKLTLGSWENVELNAFNQDIGNRKITKAKDSIFISVENWKLSINVSTATSNVQRLKNSFQIKSLGREKKYGSIFLQTMKPLKKNILYCICMMGKMFLIILLLIQVSGK